MSEEIEDNLALAKTGSYEEQECELYFSKGSHVQGVVHMKGMARIDGYVEGEIHADHMVHIGKDALIVADIHTNHLIASGPIRGDIIAREEVELLAPATVEGAISSPKFTIEQGVQVNGMLRMGKM